MWGPLGPKSVLLLRFALTTWLSSETGFLVRIAFTTSGVSNHGRLSSAYRFGCFKWAVAWSLTVS